LSNVKTNFINIFWSVGTRTAQSVYRISYMLDGIRYKSWQGQEIFLFSQMPRLALEPMQPPVKQVLALFPRHKAAMVCNDHLPPSSTHVKNEWSHTSTHFIFPQDMERHNLNFYLVRTIRIRFCTHIFLKITKSSKHTFSKVCELPLAFMIPTCI